MHSYHVSLRTKHKFLNKRNKVCLLVLGNSAPSVIQKCITENLSYHKNYILDRGVLKV